MALELYVGRRLSFEASLCTVRYIGPLTGAKGEWLGVEWDDPSRGKHDGHHKDQRIFTCLSHSPTAASFVKSSRRSDPELTVLEAIKSKYGTDSNTSGSEAIVISGKVAEEVGFDKIAKEQAQLGDLRIVLIDQLIVSGLVTRGASASEAAKAQQALRITCPNVVEIDIGWNVIEQWQDVADICAALPKLRTLRVGGLRLRSFKHLTTPSPFSNIRELHLEDHLLTPTQIHILLDDVSGFPQLNQLYLSGNQLDTLSSEVAMHPIPSVDSLVLENNLFENLDCIVQATSLFPNLRSLSLQANQISTIGTLPNPDESTFPRISSLDMSSNLITTYDFLDRLPPLFPCLTSLRITKNPLYSPTDTGTAHDPRASDKSYYLSLARIPTLENLNYTKITTRDRGEGEIYYLSIVEKELRILSSQSRDLTEMKKLAKKLYPRYEALTAKYHRVSLFEELDRTGNALDAEQQSFPPGSLGFRLVDAVFYIGSGSAKTSPKAEAALQLPSSLPVTKVMSLILQLPAFRAHLKPLQFNLICESKELDPVDTTTDSTTRSALYGRKLTAEQKQELWKGWGDWNADTMMEEALQKEGRSNLNSSSEIHDGTEMHWTEDGKFCVIEGRNFKRREVEIPHALKRPWGDWLERAKEVRIRVEPFERQRWR